MWRAKGLGFRVQGLGFRVRGARAKVVQATATKKPHVHFKPALIPSFSYILKSLYPKP